MIRASPAEQRANPRAKAAKLRSAQRTGSVVTTLDDLRRYAVDSSLFPPTTLKRAQTFGFVQADPIRAPARAQDLTLRHRVKGYLAGDLERRYATLGVEEDTFINYGFVASVRVRADASSRGHLALVHGAPQEGAGTAGVRRANAAPCIRAKWMRHFSHGRVTNYWGGSSTATTHLLEDMHYREPAAVARREGGVRIYAVHTSMLRGRCDAAAAARGAHRRARRRDRAEVRTAARGRACRRW